MIDEQLKQVKFNILSQPLYFNFWNFYPNLNFNRLINISPFPYQPEYLRFIDNNSNFYPFFHQNQPSAYRDANSHFQNFSETKEISINITKNENIEKIKTNILKNDNENINNKKNINKDYILLKKKRKKIPDKENINNNKKKILKKEIYKKEDDVLTNLIYRINTNDENIYFYSCSKRYNKLIAYLNCRDKKCQSKAKYNLATKEFTLLSGHSFNIQTHSYIFEGSHFSTIDSLKYMKENPWVKGIEIFKKKHNIINEIILNPFKRKEMFIVEKKNCIDKTDFSDGK